MERPHRHEGEINSDALPAHGLRQGGYLPTIILMQTAPGPGPEALVASALSDQKGDHRFEVLGVRIAQSVEGRHGARACADTMSLKRAVSLRRN